MAVGNHLLVLLRHVTLGYLGEVVDGGVFYESSHLVDKARVQEDVEGRGVGNSRDPFPDRHANGRRAENGSHACKIYKHNIVALFQIGCLELSDIATISEPLLDMLLVRNKQWTVSVSLSVCLSVCLPVYRSIYQYEPNLSVGLSDQSVRPYSH